MAVAKKYKNFLTAVMFVCIADFRCSHKTQATEMLASH